MEWKPGPGVLLLLDLTASSLCGIGIGAGEEELRQLGPPAPPSGGASDLLKALEIDGFVVERVNEHRRLKKTTA